MPEIKNSFENSNGCYATHSVNIAGLDSAEIIKKLGGLWSGNREHLKLYENGGCYSLEFKAYGSTADECARKSGYAVANIKNKLKGYAYAVDGLPIAEHIVGELKENHTVISTAESCTAGLVSAAVTDVSGASQVFEAGVVTYADEIKTDRLGVNAATIEKYGAVSAETAAEMAYRVRKLAGSDIGLSVSGVAGPDPVENKTVGYVCFGLCDGEKVWTSIARFNIDGCGDVRKFVREHSVSVILNMLRRYVENDPEFFALGSAIDEKLTVFDAFSDETRQFDYIPKLSFNEVDAEAAEGNADAKISRDEKKPAGERKKKKPLYKQIIPWKGDKVTDIILKIVLIAAIITFIVSALYIGDYFYNSRTQQKIIDNAKTMIADTDEVNSETFTYSKFDKLVEQNKDFIGWITIPGTNVDNPVYQTDNDNYYINHNMNREKNSHGALFMGSDCAVSAELRSSNLTIYGHSMKDGTMFGTLKRYRKLDFYKQNPTFEFQTLYSPEETYKIFAVMVTNSTPEQDDGYVFDYTIPDFPNDSTFNAWVSDVKDRSFWNIPVDVEPTDKLVTLSTCDYDFDGARLVIFARATRQDEDASVDVENAAKNTDPDMPQGWYDAKK